MVTAAALGWSRLVARRRGDTSSRPANAGWLLALATIGIWSHPLLDLLNTYGVRLLMPFSQRWFYGDALFILDPWVWAVLSLGIIGSKRRERRAASPEDSRRATRPARVALGVAVTYALVMAGVSPMGRVLVERRSQTAALRTMVAPVPGTPFRREVIRDLGGQYEFGELDLLRPAYSRIGVESTGSDSPAARAAAVTPAGIQFLRWSRFPRYVTERRGDSIRVIMSDARYANPVGGSWASVVVTVPAGGG